MPPDATPDSGQREYIRPTSLEIATCAVIGRSEAAVSLVPTSRDPLEALEKALLPALARPPCVVSFSGGRDSSAVLAVALQVARHEGLPAPVALTIRWPAYPETDESEWQELVAKNLGVGEWEKIEFEENEVIGPTFAPSLKRLGVLWPPLLHSWPPIFRRAEGGSFVTGEGGDEVLGDRRCSWLRRVLWGKPNKAILIGTARSLAPKAYRRQAALRTYKRDVLTPWLRPEARRLYLELLATNTAAEPYRWGAGMRWHLESRSVVVGSHNLALLAAEQGTVLYEPLLDPGFVGSLLPMTGALGFPGRTGAMRALFSGLLPDDVLARRGKAYTTSMVFGERSRDFISGWGGEGLDDGLVDPEGLATAWKCETPPPGTLLLLQKAWLASLS